MPRSSQLPTISMLGRDLLATGAGQRRMTLARPFLLVGLYALVYGAGWWWATPFIVFLLFIAIVTSAHDVVHGSLGLSRQATEWALFTLGGVLLASGHSYRTSHLQHHRNFPGPDDPEGDPARMTLWGAVRHGPVFLPVLWYWAWKRSSPSERRWLLAEAAWAMFVVIAGFALWPTTRALLLYAGLVYSGVWVFPLLTVHLPHRNYRDTPFYADPHPSGPYHSGALPRTHVPSRAPSVPTDSEPQPGQAFAAPGSHVPRSGSDAT